jgi:hypothetical protein
MRSPEIYSVFFDQIVLEVGFGSWVTPLKDNLSTRRQNACTIYERAKQSVNGLLNKENQIQIFLF